MSAFYTDPETGVIYWRDEHGILRPRVLTAADGEVVGYEQAAGWFPSRVTEPGVAPPNPQPEVDPKVRHG